MSNSIQTVIDSLATIAEADKHILDSSDGRHQANGVRVGKRSANRVSVSDGEKRPKAVTEALKREVALTVLCEACADFKLAIAAARAVIIAAAKEADKARRAAPAAK